MARALWLTLLVFAACRVAWAHGGPAEGRAGPDLWSPNFVALTALILGATLYGTGLRRMWRSCGIGRGVSRARAIAFATGLLTLGIALLSPLDRLSAALSSAHMVQHMLLMLVAAPLLVLGSPALVLLWVLPLRFRGRLGRLLGRLEGWHSPSYRIWQPLLCWSLYAATLWIWHLPALYQAALRNARIHDLQHAAFIATSFLFWRVLIDPIGRLRLSRGLSVLYLFTTSLHACALGVFMALAPRVWYLDYVATTPLFRLTPLEDQQIAGLIMWVPCCMLYAGAAALLLGLWLEGEDRAGASLHAARRAQRRGAKRSGAIPIETMLPLVGLTLAGFVAFHLAVRGGHEVPVDPRWQVPGGDPARGRLAIERHGCGSCHVITGVRDARGRVGPQLTDFQQQGYIAGQLPNVPHNLVAWILNPQRFAPGTAMPDLPVSEAEARDMAAYLYRQR